MCFLLVMIRSSLGRGVSPLRAGPGGAVHQTGLSVERRVAQGDPTAPVATDSGPPHHRTGFVAQPYGRLLLM